MSRNLLFTLQKYYFFCTCQNFFVSLRRNCVKRVNRKHRYAPRKQGRKRVENIISKKKIKKIPSESYNAWQRPRSIAPPLCLFPCSGFSRFNGNNLVSGRFFTANGGNSSPKEKIPKINFASSTSLGKTERSAPRQGDTSPTSGREKEKWIKGG